MRNLQLLCLAAAVSLIFTQTVNADSAFIRGRGGMGIGLWDSHFSQKGNGAQMSNGVPLSSGFEFRFGGQIGLLFADYTPVYFLPWGGGSGKATYSSPLGFDLGIELPMLPIEGYFGYEAGKYDFSTVDTAGKTLKFGAAIRIFHSGKYHFGLIGEYRRMYIYSDSNGEIPSIYSTRSNIYFVGLNIIYFSSER